MALEDDIRILERVGLLKDFTSEQLRLLAFGAENMRFAAGRELYREGSEADCGFVLAVGTVELSREIDGEQIVFQEVGPSSLLGEYALIAGGSRLTTAMAKTDIEVIRLNRSLFRRILEEYPDLATTLRDHVAAELQGLLNRIVRLETKFRG